MAIDTEAARLLVAGMKSGIPFTNTITLGRQSYLPGNRESRQLLLDCGIDPARHPGLFAGRQGERYAEPFFRLLGAHRIESLDASDFEGATTVHDLNQPIASELKGQFDVVYDGGTLEHVFNFLVAIRNCMELVRVGGRVILHTTANNYFGHGFYQYSPELFFRIFTADNGFSVERLIAMEYGPRRRWYEVSDPASIKARTPLINAYPVLLFVQARKDAEGPLFEQVPQQSDYSSMWQGCAARGKPETASRAGVPASAGARFKRALIERAPASARMLEAFKFSDWNRAFSFRNRAAFRPVNKRRL
ncbi:MAG TPA: hypothetical protein PK640_06190 [Verrucomicrobiota bacterium]|nr:hypothetical protein [Verrucomicrobiota bacterium]